MKLHSPATTGSGVIGYGMGHDDGIFGRAWFGFGLPDNYSSGTDVAAGSTPTTRVRA